MGALPRDGIGGVAVVGRISLLAFVAASGIVHRFSELPTLPARLVWPGCAVLASLALLCLSWRRRGMLRPKRVLWPLWAAVAGLLMTMARADDRLADRLDPGNENKVSRVVLRIAALPRLGPDSRQFEAEVLSSSPPGVPGRILVSWTAGDWAGPYGRAGRPPAEFPELIPGQVWRMALTLKTPRGKRNPHAFDFEGHVFAQGLRAMGSVRGQPVFLRDEPWSSLPVVAQRARHAVRAAMQPHLDGKRYGGVLLALAIGDQASVESTDWDIFNRAGLTHAVAISGGHITMISGIAGVLAFRLWRRLGWRSRPLAERLPAQIAGALAALAVAWLYCLLAGWGVPARRTFMMLAVVAGAYLLRMPIGASRLLAMAAFLVVLLDPWALLASGFWLSFGAVCILMASSGWWGASVGGGPAGWRRHAGLLGRAAVLQLAITAGLMPLLAFIFHEVSIISPLANAYALPVIGLLVTPLSLLSAAAAMTPGLGWAAAACAWAGHAALDAAMAPTVWLAGLRIASFGVSAAPWWLTLLALLGLAVALMPYGLPGRRWGWLLIAPLLSWMPPRPGEGGWRLHALDVGQAGAIVVQTARHSLVFDTGLRSSPVSDDGARTVWPFLRSQGIRRLDALVVSHADIDHAGGVRSLLQAAPVEQSFSSFDLQSYLRREAGLLGEPGRLPFLPLAMTACEYGLHWDVDGVSFEFLWPLAVEPFSDGRAADRGTRSGKAPHPTAKRNDHACVLHIRGRHHSALLSSDIGAAQEAALVERGLQPVDVVMAGHHGSKTSSSAVFVNAVQAVHVVAQAGAWNRYGHPHPDVEARWKRSGASFWRSDRHGAVSFDSGPDGLAVRSERQAARRYWQAE